MTTKHIYQVQTNDPHEINIILAQLMDRLDKMDTSITESQGTFATYNWETTYQERIK